MRLDTIVPATARSSRGKNEARRLRVSGKIPAVIYGAFKEPLPVSVNPKDITKIMRSKSGHNSIFDVDVEGVERTPVILADEQFDPIKGNLLHVDLRRIDLARKLKVSIPIHTSGDAKGVKQQGGILDVVTRSIEIECVPDDIPNDYEVNVTELMIGQGIRVSDLPVRPGVRVITPGDAVVAHVTGIKEEAAAADAAKEPEVVKKGKKEAPAADAAPAKKK